MKWIRSFATTLPTKPLPLLGMCFAGFFFLSWILLLRDERAIPIYESLYPALSDSLTTTRVALLPYGLNILPTLAFAVMALVAFLAYIWSLRTSFSVQTVVKAAVTFQLLAFLSYPILSSDIFSYMSADRVYTEYGQNAWIVTPDTFPEDRFAPLADWKDQTKVYGAVNQIVYLPAAYLGNDDVASTLVLYKLTTLVFALGSLVVFWKLTAGSKDKVRAVLLQTIFWNPLFVLEMAGNGHNDIIMIFFVLLSILLWKQQRWLWAGVTLALAVQVKLIPVVLFAYFAWYLLQKKNWAGLFRYSGAFLVINALSFLYMQVSPLQFLERVLYNNSVYWQSLPALAEKFWPGSDLPFGLILVGVGVGLACLQWMKKWHPIFTSALALLLYLLFFSSAYWNWYVLWVLVLIPFIKESWLKRTILALSFTSLLAYPLLWLSLRYGFGNPIWPIVSYLWIFGVPVGVWVREGRRFSPDSTKKLRHLS